MVERRQRRRSFQRPSGGAAIPASLMEFPMIDERGLDSADAPGVTYDDRFWDGTGTLQRVARAGFKSESHTILLQNAPLWALVAKAIETEKYASFMGGASIRMASGFSYGPEAIRELAAMPDRWTEWRPIQVPP
jgi:hypothetical protein